MDIMAIVTATFQGLNFGSIVSGLIAGVLVAKLLDNIIFAIIAKYFPQKYIDMALAKIKVFDDKYLDTFAKKYPKAGKELEAKIAKFFTDASKIILS